MKKIYLLLFIITTLYGCVNNNKNSKGTKNLMKVSFEKGSSNSREGIYVAYTNDEEGLWVNDEWVKSIKAKMKNLSSSYSTVLLFYGEDNTPNVASKGMNYSANGLWILAISIWENKILLWRDQR